MKGIKMKFRNKNTGEIVEFDKVTINSALLGAQNRQRNYWCGGYKDGKVYQIEITQPEDMGILLKDIIEDGESDRDKSLTVTTRIAGATKDRYLNKSMRQIIKVGNVNSSGNGMNGNVFNIEGKCPTLTTNKGEGIKITGGAQRGRYLVDGKRADTSVESMAGLTEQRIELREDGKSNCLTTVQKDSLVVSNKISYRKLTVKECCRLQNYQDDYCDYGIEIHSQACYNIGNELTQQRNYKCVKTVESRDVINPSGTTKLNYAINTTLDTLKTQTLGAIESLSIKAKNVLMKTAIETSKLLSVNVLSIIKNGKGYNQLMNLRYVSFVIKQSGVGHVECVLSTMQNGFERETLYRATVENITLMETQGNNIIKMKTVDLFIKLLQKKYLEENCSEVRLFITLTLINLTIAKVIFLSASPMGSTHLYIDSSNQWQQNCLETKLLYLETGNITAISKSSGYKMLGNGFDRATVAHCLKHILEV